MQLDVNRENIEGGTTIKYIVRLRTHVRRKTTVSRSRTTARTLREAPLRWAEAAVDRSLPRPGGGQREYPHPSRPYPDPSAGPGGCEMAAPVKILLRFSVDEELRPDRRAPQNLVKQEFVASC